MTFSVTQRGVKSVQRSLFALAQRSPRLLIDAVDEVNKRHALAYRRRRIPRDTGRLEDSLTFERHPDRRVIATVTHITIKTAVPYAKYQRRRIRPLTRPELKEIFIDPMVENFRVLVQEGG